VKSRTLLVPLAVALLVSSRSAYAQPAPLPTLPPPAPSAAPSTLNPLPSAPATIAPPPLPAAPAQPPPAPAPPYDVTYSSPPTVTQVAAPLPPPPPPPSPPPPSPIDCTGPGAFTHDGFYLRIGSGIGGLGVGGSGPRGDVRFSGLSSGTMLAIGGTPSTGFVAGGAISTMTLTSIHSSGVSFDTTSISAGRLAVFADWFPNEHRGWHVGGMVGLGFTTLGAAGQSNWTGASVGGEAFGGYDFWIGPEWSLGIQGALAFTTQGPLKDDNQNDTGYSLGSFGAVVEATLLYH